MLKNNTVQNSSHIQNSIIIVLCSALITTLIILLTAGKTNRLCCMSIVISIFAFIFTIVTVLWHQWRFPKRQAIFEERKETILNEYQKQTQKATELILSPSIRKLVRNEYGQKYKDTLPSCVDDLDKRMKNLVEEKKDILREKIGKKFQEDAAPIVLSLLRNMLTDFDIDYHDSFYKPLNEKCKNILLILDILAWKLRYILFSFGIVFFLISIILKVTSIVS